MKRITLSIMLVAAVGIVGGAQTPPTPPARPAPQTPPPSRAPRAAEPPYRYEYRDLDEIRIRAADIARMTSEIDREAIRANAEAVRAQSAEIAQAAREAAREANRISLVDAREMAEMAREQARMNADIAQFAPMPRMDFTPMPPMPAMAPMPFRYSGGDDLHIARPFFQQGEPADSMYRLAHEALNRGDYGRAAQMFKEIGQKYPKTIYENELPYYEAAARYRIGTTAELENAAKLLEPRASKLIGSVTPTAGVGINSNSYRSRTSEADVAALYI
ncbi:MAG: hypothetical protein ACRDMZ_07550, partial [Solirubrobacteraceae bacterium]